MQVKSLEESSARYARNSLKAYLEGRKNLNWVASIIGTGATARQMLSALSGYGNPERYKELSDWFDSHH